MNMYIYIHIYIISYTSELPLLYQCFKEVTCQWVPHQPSPGRPWLSASSPLYPERPGRSCATRHHCLRNSKKQRLVQMGSNFFHVLENFLAQKVVQRRSMRQSNQPSRGLRAAPSLVCGSGIPAKVVCWKIHPFRWSIFANETSMYSGFFSLPCLISRLANATDLFSAMTPNGNSRVHNLFGIHTWGSTPIKG